MGANRLVPGPVRRIVRLGVGSYGRLTADHRVLPSFLLCGGPRCGTTMLARVLSAHPAVLTAVPRRPVHYFDTGYDRGPRWYRAHFPTQRAADRIAWRLGVPPVTFESNPDYLYHPHAVARIARDLPEVRVIVLVRDPVDRAYSHHAQQVARGFEPERDLRRALALEPMRLRGEYERMVADPGYRSLAHQHYGYRARGDYARYLARMATYLPRERILVLETGDLLGHPESVYDRVLEFLGLPHLGYPPLDPPRPDPPSARVDARVRQEMAAYYAARDAELEPWLGHPPSWRAVAADAPA